MTTTEPVEFVDAVADALPDTLAQGPGAAPGDDGLADLDDLPVPPRRARRVSPATAVLALVAVACTGFAVGVAIEKRQLPVSNNTQVAAATTRATATTRPGATTTAAGRTPTSPSPTATPTTAAPTAAGAAPAAGAGGAGGGGGGTGGNIVGQVTSIDGTTLVVTTSSGATVRVNTSASSAVTKSSVATVADIHQGDFVTVTGSAASDGTTEANRIVDTGSATGPGPAGAVAGAAPAGGAAGGGGAGGAGAGGAGGAGGRRGTTTSAP